MEVFIQNKAVETIERSRVIDSIKGLIGERNYVKDCVNGVQGSENIVRNLDDFLKILKDDFPLEYQIASDKYKLEIEAIRASWAE